MAHSTWCEARRSSTSGPSGRIIEEEAVKRAVPAHPEVPISKAVRAGDFVFTSAYGPWTFDPTKVSFDEAGRILDDGTDNQSMPFDEQVHRTFDFVKAALASL